MVVDPNSLVPLSGAMGPGGHPPQSAAMVLEGRSREGKAVGVPGPTGLLRVAGLMAVLDTLTDSAFLHCPLFEPLPSLEKVWGYFTIETSPIKSSSRTENKGKIRMDIIRSGVRRIIQRGGGARG